MALVTVTCDRDLDIARLQAYSINKFLQGSHTHYLVIENSKKTTQELLEIFQPLYTRHKLEIVEAKTLVLINHLPGYIRQQVLKFAISEKITDEFYLLLDSKDILLRNVELDQWGSEEGNNLIYKPFKNSKTLRETLAPELQVYFNFANLCQKILGTSSPEWFWAPTTPFRCRTSTVKKLLGSLDVDRVFDPYVTNIKEVSEFILYRFFSEFEPDLSIVQENFWSTGNNTKFMWANKDIEIDFSIFKNDFYKSVSFHRWYIANNASRIDKIKNVLVDYFGLDCELVEKGFDPIFWTKQTWHERGNVLFDQFDIGFRLDNTG